MKTFAKENWVTIFLIITAGLCFFAHLIASDNMYTPTIAQDTEKITPVYVEEVGEGVDRFYLSTEGIEVRKDTLLFYTNHQEVYVYVGDKLIYSVEKADSIFGGTTGAIWNKVELPMGTKDVVVEVHQVYDRASEYALKFEIGDAITMYQRVLQNSVQDLVMSISIIVVGFDLYAYWMFTFSKTNKQREVLYLGVFGIVFGMWALGEVPLVTFMFTNRQAVSYTAFTCLMTMGVPFVMFVREFMEVEHKCLHKIICGYIVVATCVCQILHFTGIAGVKETNVLTLVSIGLCLLYLLYGILSSIKHKRNKRKIYANIVGLLALSFTAIADTSSYYLDIANSNRYGKIGFLVYVVILGVESARTAYAHMQEEHKIEILKQMAVMDMLTGCFNRNAYVEDSEQLESLEGIQIITFDLNDLKKCNDTKGHMAGDAYIRTAAEMIKTCFGDLGRVYRIGGDEFCIITKSNRKGTILNKKIELVKMMSHYLIEHPDEDFGIACGWAEYDAELDRNVETIRDRADVFMYENKKELKR